jgi:hypothetical protein
MQPLNSFSNVEKYRNFGVTKIKTKPTEFFIEGIRIR